MSEPWYTYEDGKINSETQKPGDTCTFAEWTASGDEKSCHMKAPSPQVCQLCLLGLLCEILMNTNHHIEGVKDKIVDIDKTIYQFPLALS